MTANYEMRKRTLLHDLLQIRREINNLTSALASTNVAVFKADLETKLTDAKELEELFKNDLRLLISF